ncbi:alkaline phosphatase [Bacillus mangrovi]|uniref:Alkaline phosphatase n=1 Tax=Metabacillus mangrovi TaxID=1491830 RepID=A0A7X2S7E3_9BACI|nr:alkaline phosphatase [Metabacillus mangrovi]MTH54566.1 alkaline phosphatase [Metabacillus mangrovi]
MKEKQPLDEWMEKLKEVSFQENKFNRKKFFEGAGKIAGLTLGATIAQSMAGFQPVQAAPKFSNYPFTLGVASGDPLSDSVILWTRLAPDPLNGGGMERKAIPVKWELAKDEHFKKIIQRGEELATPELGHSVHAEATGLKPNTEYYYRFKSGHELSPIGKTKTIPKAGTAVSSMTFAFASCQQYEHGYYTAFQHMAEENLDFVIHLGDYIYEYGPNEYVSKSGNVRTHSGPEIMNLLDYRNRYAQYRSDANLKAAHAAFPWIVTWDDHEVENNYANLIPENDQSVEAFVKRRAAGYQAYYEHMPLRKTSLPNGADMKLYRDFSYGDLAFFNVMDTRQYRDDQANGDGGKPQSDESLNPKRTLTGNKQEKWLMKNLAKSKTSWNVLAQQVFFAQQNYGTPESPKFNMDAWDGYPASRKRITDFIAGQNLNNIVVLTGDVHASWASNLTTDYDNPDAKIFGAEFVGTSITSGGNGADKRADTDTILKQNPHIQFFNDYRGYVRCTVTPESWQSDYRIVPFVTSPGAAVSTRASLVYQKDQNGLLKVASSQVPEGIQKSDEVEDDRMGAHLKAHKKQNESRKEKVTQ